MFSPSSASLLLFLYVVGTTLVVKAGTSFSLLPLSSSLLSPISVPTAIIKTSPFAFSSLMSSKPLRRRSQILSIRAGGITRNRQPTSFTKVSSSSFLVKRQRIKNGFVFVACSFALFGLWRYRTIWSSVFDKEKLQDYAVQTLEKLNNMPYLYSRVFYVVSMALWEMMGMSTIPVETASGMVFGWSGFYWSAIGKLLGACLAFGLGRGALSTVVNNKLSSNTFLKLVHSSAEENPLLVVILIKLSCFPETVKNFGSSLLKPIRWWMFISATAVHGWTFTLLWTYLGVDTAARLKDMTDYLPSDLRLQTLLTLALVNGIVVSPLAVIFWMRKLKEKSDHKYRRTGIK